MVSLSSLPLLFCTHIWGIGLTFPELAAAFIERIASGYDTALTMIPSNLDHWTMRASEMLDKFPREVEKRQLLHSCDAFSRTTLLGLSSDLGTIAQVRQEFDD